MVVVNFVTGGSGFIGQRLVTALKQSGGEIRFLSRKSKFEDTKNKVLDKWVLKKI